MTTLADKYPTLLEVSKQFTQDGTPLPLAEMLSQENEILIDMPFYEGNTLNGHIISQRTGLPTAYYRKLNQGTPVSKSTYAQITETCGELVAWGDVDEKIVKMNGNSAKFRMNQNFGHIDAMNITMATNVFYGNSSVDPEKFMGLSTRYNSLSAENADNIIVGGGATNLTSIWLVGWSDRTCYGIYPKGGKSGLSHEDLGIDTINDANGNPYRAYRDKFSWEAGIALHDWRYVVRIPNIDVTALTKNAGTGADLTDLMAQALERIKSLTGVRPVFYMNRTLRSFLRRQIINKVANSTLTMDQVGGRPEMQLSEVPIRRTDALLNSESAVA